MARPTVVTKDSFVATVHPHFGFDTRHQRGRAPLHRAFRRPRGAVPQRIADPDSGQQAAADFAPSAPPSHRRPQRRPAQ